MHKLISLTPSKDEETEQMKDFGFSLRGPEACCNLLTLSESRGLSLNFSFSSAMTIKKRS